MSYERYKDYRIAPDYSGCWSVLTGEYEQVATYPSKAAAKRAIDELTDHTDGSNDIVVANYNERLNNILRIELDDMGTKTLKLIDTNEAKQAILRWVADEFNIMELNDVYAESDTARGAVRQAKANYAVQFKQRLAQHGYKGGE